ncbi:hypothetical protein KR009_008641 [Drosophila setifemur]|nr:hypothetical protein KR009_008641 [Drosophila setifemur]
MSNGSDKESSFTGRELEREEGGALSVQLLHPSLPPPSPPISLPEQATGSRILDKRLNPNAPDFVPSYKVGLLATKLYDDLSPYTRWSTASTEDIPYGPRFEAIWRERSIQPQPISTCEDVEEEDPIVCPLEDDEQQAMNIGAESYEPKPKRLIQPADVFGIVESVQAQYQLPQQQLLLRLQQDPLAQEGRVMRKNFQTRRSVKSSRCWDACQLM